MRRRRMPRLSGPIRKPGRASPPSSSAKSRGVRPMLIVGNRTLKSALEDKARRFSDRPFLVFEDAAGSQARWTWREFDEDVNRAAHLLLARGLRHGDKFNLHLGNCPEFLLFWLAAAKTGTVM